MIIDKDHPENGIQEFRYIDPRKIRKIREVIKTRDPTGIEIIKDMKEYFLYNERGILGLPSNLGTKIAPDSVLFVPSGILDPKQQNVISYLQQAMKAANQLRMGEDALVIYRLARAPERRVFYIDVGNMPTQKAQQYVASIMTKYKNKLVYDATTGEVRDDRRHLSMLEDFWLPRREGNKGTEISTLPGGENLGEITDIEYFQKKLFKALFVPISRLEPTTGFSLGRSTEITRDELAFMKFIDGLRTTFSKLFDDALKTQLVLKGICSEEDWKEFRHNIYYDFLKDNNFTELKEQELWSTRFSMLAMVDPYTGKYVSVKWVRKNILKQTDEDIEELDKECKEELNDPRFANPMLNGGQGLGGGPMGLGGPNAQNSPFGPGPAGNQGPEMNSNQEGAPQDQNAPPTGSRFASGGNNFIPVKKRVAKIGGSK
jgi:hypothetical protein